MKTLKKHSLAFLCVCLILPLNKVNAQSDSITKLTADTAYFPGPVRFTGAAVFCNDSGDAIVPKPAIHPPLCPLQDDHWFTTDYYCIMGGHIVGPPSYPPNYAVNDLTAFGISNQNPQFMVDILCDPSVPTYSDVNISSAATLQSVGYRIGGEMFLWNSGDRTSFYAGIQAGSFPTTATATGNFNNTGVGTDALENFNGVNGRENTAVGFNTLYSNTGNYNTAVGAFTLANNTAGAGNTAVGDEALGYTNGATASNNTAVGAAAMWENLAGASNTAEGQNALYWNNADYNVGVGCGAMFGPGRLYQGILNTASGYYALQSINAGNYNVSMGATSLDNVTNGDSNAGIGYQSLYYITSGPNNAGGNAALGAYAGLSSTNPIGYDNTYVGAMADVLTNNPVNGATAIGTRAIVVNSNQMEFGNNNVNGTIGLSGQPPSYFSNAAIGATNLEIATENSPWPYGWSVNSTTANYYASGSNQSTGTSGLRFHDLTNASIPITSTNSNFYNAQEGTSTFPTGVLSLDAYGNVIYIVPPPGPSAFPTCSNQPSLISGASNDPAANLAPSGTNLHNYWFEGNGETNQYTNVYMGYQCPNPTEFAKLNVLQSSGSQSTTCAYFENQDIGSATSCSDPIIGIESLVDPPSSSYGYNEIAGWFQAPISHAKNCCGTYSTQYAIFVPKYGGNVEIGVPTPNLPAVPCANQCLLDVYGTFTSYTGLWPSDSNLKNHITPIKKNADALGAIQKLNGMSYYYNRNIISDSGMEGTHYGFIAQQVAKVIPSIVKTDNHGIMGIEYTELIPWLVEGIKEQQKTIVHDSLRINSLESRLDSVNNYLSSIKTCLTSICSTQSGGNNSTSFSGSNSQDVSLSNANTPLLYQNIPNPFSTGTKINYYLPTGTQGATIVFYDSYGNQIKVVTLSQTGNGTLNITPDNLTSGIYSYSLVVNNNVVDTKRMILQK